MSIPGALRGAAGGLRHWCGLATVAVRPAGGPATADPVSDRPNAWRCSGPPGTRTPRTSTAACWPGCRTSTRACRRTDCRPGSMSLLEPPAYALDVLEVVERIPAGRVMSYGDVAEFLGAGGPRQVGWVMSHFGSDVPWWRVLRADGTPLAGPRATGAGGVPAGAHAVAARRAAGRHAPRPLGRRLSTSSSGGEAASVRRGEIDIVSSRVSASPGGATGQPRLRLLRAARPPLPAPALDPEQLAAVAHRGGPLRVLGAPGTGVTTTIVEAVVDRVERGGLTPDEVLVLAPTRLAAAELRERITGRLDRTAREPIARTPASLAFGILRRAAARRGTAGAPAALRSRAGRRPARAARRSRGRRRPGPGLARRRPGRAAHPGLAGRAARPADARGRARAGRRGPGPPRPRARAARVGGRCAGARRVRRGHRPGQLQRLRPGADRRSGASGRSTTTPTCWPTYAAARGSSRSTTPRR